MNARDVQRLHKILEQNRAPGAGAGRPATDRENEQRCPECNSRITKTNRLGEVGHRTDCSRRADRYNGASNA